MRIFNLAYAGFLWFLASLPLITIGASTTALYAYAFAVTGQRDGYVGRTFFSSFKKNFVQATLVWVIMLAIFSFLFFDAYLASIGNTILSKVVFFIILSVGVIAAMPAVHVFPLLSQRDLSYKEILRKSFIVGVGRLPISITLVVVNLLFFLLLYAFPPAVLFVQGFVTALCSLFLKTLYLHDTVLNDT